MKNCRNCGQDLQPNWILCPNCKTPIPMGQYTLRNPPINTEKESDKKAGGILLILGIPLAIFSIIMLISNYYWMLYYIDQFGNPGLYDIPVVLSVLLLVISIILIIFGIFMKLRSRWFRILSENMKI